METFCLTQSPVPANCHLLPKLLLKPCIPGIGDCLQELPIQNHNSIVLWMQTSPFRRLLGVQTVINTGDSQNPLPTSWYHIVGWFRYSRKETPFKANKAGRRSGNLLQQTPKNYLSTMKQLGLIFLLLGSFLPGHLYKCSRWDNGGNISNSGCRNGWHCPITSFTLLQNTESLFGRQKEQIVEACVESDWFKWYRGENDRV